MRKITTLLAVVGSAFLFSGCLSGPEKTPGINVTGTNKETIAQPPTENNQIGNGMSELSAGMTPSGNNNSKQNEPMENQTTKSQPDLSLAEKYDGAILKTNLGDIKVQFYGEDSPITVSNFLKLASENFYNETKFHRVIKDFMIQGGDPNSKDDDWSNDGVGEPGYTFEDEFNSHKLVRGSLAMANSGPNTNGSQFFIVTADATSWLDGKHTNFGKIIEGMEVVEKIEKVEVNEKDHPMKDVVVESIELLEKQ